MTGKGNKCLSKQTAYVQASQKTMAKIRTGSKSKTWKKSVAFFPTGDKKVVTYVPLAVQASGYKVMNNIDMISTPIESKRDRVN